VLVQLGQQKCVDVLFLPDDLIRRRRWDEGWTGRAAGSRTNEEEE